MCLSSTCCFCIKLRPALKALAMARCLLWVVMLSTVVFFFLLNVVVTSKHQEKKEEEKEEDENWIRRILGFQEGEFRVLVRVDGKDT